MTRHLLSIALSIATLSAAAMGCVPSSEPSGKVVSKAERKKKAVFPVEVQAVASRRMDYAVQSVGTLLAMDTVLVSARVSGVVEKVRFMEGSHVEKGAVLAEIEPDRFRIALASAKATYEKAKAEATEARSAFLRRDKLARNSPGLISAEEVESYAGKHRMAQAAEAQAKAAMDLAELNLRDAFVRAPIAGVMDTKSVSTGTYVQPGSSLASIVKRDPMLLETNVSTEEAALVSIDMPLTFDAVGATGLKAVVRHVGQRASVDSRRVRVLAEVEDGGKALRPGDFVRVTIPIDAGAESPVVPQKSIRPSERGFLAYVVDGEGIARERVLKLGMRTQDGMVQILDGIQPGEQVVVRGAEALFEGARVRRESSEESVQAKKPATKAQADGAPKS